MLSSNRFLVFADSGEATIHVQVIADYCLVNCYPDSCHNGWFLPLLSNFILDYNFLSSSSAKVYQVLNFGLLSTKQRIGIPNVLPHSLNFRFASELLLFLHLYTSKNPDIRSHMTK